MRRLIQGGAPSWLSRFLVLLFVVTTNAASSWVGTSLNHTISTPRDQWEGVLCRSQTRVRWIGKLTNSTQGLWNDHHPPYT